MLTISTVISERLEGRNIREDVSICDRDNIVFLLGRARIGLDFTDSDVR